MRPGFERKYFGVRKNLGEFVEGSTATARMNGKPSTEARVATDLHGSDTARAKGDHTGSPLRRQGGGTHPTTGGL